MVFDVLKATEDIDTDARQELQIEFMETVIKLKLEQNHSLLELALACAREAILLVQISQDDRSSGPDGLGSNQLGLIIHKIANQC